MSLSNRIQELERRFAEWLPRLPGTHGPVYRDASRDNSATLQAAIDAAIEDGGGRVQLPAGEFLVNLDVLGSNVELVGQGRHATILRPSSLTAPALKVGDGTADVQNTRVADLSIIGTGAGASSDGLHIEGAYNTRVSNVEISEFGRNNVYLTSSATRPTYYAGFSGLRSDGGRGSCFKVTYGSQYVTAVEVEDFFFNGHNATGATVVDTDAAIKWSDGYFEIPDSMKGHFKIDFGTVAGAPVQKLSNATFDTGVATNVLIEYVIASGRALSPQLMVGEFTVNGMLRQTSGIDTDMKGSTSFHDGARLLRPYVLTWLGFNQGDATFEEDGNQENGSNPPDCYMQRLGANGSDEKVVRLFGGKFSVSSTLATMSSGAGTPEGAITAPPGSTYTNTSGGAGTTFYVKETGSGNTGWVAK